MKETKVLIVGDKKLSKTCKEEIVWPDGGVEVSYVSAEDATRHFSTWAPRDIVVVNGCDEQLIELLSLSLATEMIVASDNERRRVSAMTRGCNHQCIKQRTVEVVSTILEMSCLCQELN